MTTMRKIVICQRHGGLGDSLAFSTLPELFTERGHEVYIYRNTPLRNAQTHDIVWGLNPYVLGLSDDEPNVGTHDEIHFPRRRLPGIVPYWEEFYLGQSYNLYPRVYYHPKFRKEFSGLTIVELNSVTYDYSCALDDVSVFIRGATEKENVVFIDNSKVSSRSISLPELSGFPVYVPADIFDFCDIIMSCKKYVSLLSGGTALASALRQRESYPELVCCCPQEDWDNGAWVFANVEYHPTSKVTRQR
jgi:hypothetical protein